MDLKSTNVEMYKKCFFANIKRKKKLTEDNIGSRAHKMMWNMTAQ